MTQQTETELVPRLAAKHDVPEDAVRTLLEALRRSGGSMAQVNHPALGGFGQWSSGMIMISDMFNDHLKAKVAALATDLAAFVRHNPEETTQSAEEVSYRSGESRHADWWPGDLGQPASTGSQNAMRYAVFPAEKRLAIDDGGHISVYDTADHAISGVAQAQGSSATLTFTSQKGMVRVSDLRKID